MTASTETVKRSSAISASETRLTAALAVAVFIASAVAFLQQGLDNRLMRDNAMHLYSGQQMAEGVPPYLSIFDPKLPGTALLSGASVATGRALGVDDVRAVRMVFLALSCGSVVALFLLASSLLRSRAAGLLAAAVLVGCWGFGFHAAAGPRAKPIVLGFICLSLLFCARRRPVASALCGGLCALIWQPTGWYAAVAVIFAWLQSDSSRLRAAARAVGGAAAPLLVVALAFGAVGALGALVDDTLLFPFRFLDHGERSLADHLLRPWNQAVIGFTSQRWILAAGLLSYLVWWPLRIRAAAGIGPFLRKDPLAPLFVSLLAPVAWSVMDFQAYPDFLVFLPYAALGFAALVRGGLSFLARHMRLPGWGVALACVALAGGLWIRAGMEYRSRADGQLHAQRSLALKLDALAGQGAIVSLGAPEILVLSRRRNADAYGVLCCGIANRLEETHPGGLLGWFREIAARKPPVIVVARAERPLMKQAWPLFANDYVRKRDLQWTQWTVLLRKSG